MKSILLLITLFICHASFSQPNPIVLCDATFYGIEENDMYKNYSDFISRTKGQEMISNYRVNNLGKLDANTGAFLFDAGTLFQFIYEINQTAGSNLRDIIFVLKKDIDDKLVLIAVGLDDNENPLYWNNKILSSFRSLTLYDPVLSLVETGVSAPPISEPISVCSYHFQTPEQNQIFIPHGQLSTYLDDYQSTANEPTTSFKFNAGALVRYITSIVGIKNVAVIFSRDGLLRLLIVGVDASGNPRYAKDPANRSMLLEHCYPCPAECPNQPITNNAYFMSDKKKVYKNSVQKKK